MHHSMKTYGGVEVQPHAFLTSTLDGDEWSASRLGCFIPRERGPSTHWIGGWVGLRASLEAVAKRKSSCPCPELKPGRPVHSLVTILTELSRLHACQHYFTKQEKGSCIIGWNNVTFSSIGNFIPKVPKHNVFKISNICSAHRNDESRRTRREDTD
jgi:hypothetical protein